MPWIKRNLFLVVAGTVALALMGGGLYYLWQGLTKNSAVNEEYEQKKRELEALYRKNPFPHETNIATAREEVEKITNAVNEARRFFNPLDVPPVSGLAFKTLLDNTIFELTSVARNSSITLPDEEDYAFSFAAQKQTLQLSPESFPGVVEQLVEVKALCSILFEARIHALTGLKRVRLTSDDPPGSKDYSDDLRITTNLVSQTVLCPYEVSFTGFSSELAAVMEGLTRSRNGFLIEALKVERFVEEHDPKRGPGPGPRPPGAPPRSPGFPPPPPPANPNENQTVLNEERFLTSMIITVVKPLPTTP